MDLKEPGGLSEHSADRIAASRLCDYHDVRYRKVPHHAIVCAAQSCVIISTICMSSHELFRFRACQRSVPVDLPMT